MTSENLLISQQKQQKMFLTMIDSGLSQLIQDEETPETMRGPLKVLKHYTKFEDKDATPPKKIIKVEKQDQEYFEYDDTKKEPMESEESAQVPEQQNDTWKWERKDPEEVKYKQMDSCTKIQSSYFDFFKEEKNITGCHASFWKYVLPKIFFFGIKDSNLEREKCVFCTDFSVTQTNEFILENSHFQTIVADC